MKRLLIVATILGAFAGTAVAQNLPGTLTAQNRAEMVGSVRAGCMDKQNHDPLNQQLGVTLDEITRYCTCIGAAMSEVITVEDLRYYLTNRRFPQPLLDHMFSFANVCAIQTINTSQ
jgi:hypothetical protein